MGHKANDMKLKTRYKGFVILFEPIFSQKPSSSIFKIDKNRLYKFITHLKRVLNGARDNRRKGLNWN